MSRRRRREEHENNERWLVSYADFITLLFAFFVVMYSISSVNEGKYRVLSDTLSGAFQQTGRQVQPVEAGDLVIVPGASPAESAGLSMIETPIPVGPGVNESPESIDLLDQDADSDLGTRVDTSESRRLGFIAGSIESVLEPFVDQELVEVSQNPLWVEVNMKSKMLFESGSARLSREALIALRDLSNILKAIPNPVQVEGYTDNVPISTQAFPSNWELSAARAASVVHLFTRLGVDPRRMAAIGYGEHRPSADNESEDGRQKNRRVTLIIMANGLNEENTKALRPTLPEQREGT